MLRALYGLTTFVERFRMIFVHSLGTLGVVTSHFDRDVYVWLRDPKDGFDFICTDVDDFKALAKDPDIWIEYITSVFLIKENGPRQYYLVNDCRDHGD